MLNLFCSYFARMLSGVIVERGATFITNLWVGRVAPTNSNNDRIRVPRVVQFVTMNCSSASFAKSGKDSAVVLDAIPLWLCSDNQSVRAHTHTTDRFLVGYARLLNCQVF